MEEIKNQLKDITQGIGKITEEVGGLGNRLDRMEAMLEKVAINSQNNTELIEANSRKINQNHLELLDKLASKKVTDNHELRILNIKEKIFS